ncbi:unnamed protein product [Dicrocoelium dendriticum]|nr:unnamed protein product [Dicrocoelium dendriticum]
MTMKTREHHLTKERLHELREIFRIIDRDRGGTVSGQELGDLIRLVSSNCSETKTKILMRRADINGDGEIGFDEFVHLITAEPSSAELDSEATREAFEVFDTDNDGYITKTELGHVLKSIGHECTDQEVEELLSEADRDGDGRVTYEEFEAMIEGPEKH